MLIKFNKTKARGEFPDLTDRKAYEVESVINDFPDDYGDGVIEAYVLVKDDSDEQVPYDAQIFDIVTAN